MGNWNINIQGVGCHHNGRPDIDADLAATQFVELLRKQGHAIESASFTYGSKVDLLRESERPEYVNVIINGQAARIVADTDYESILLLAGYSLHDRPSMTYARAHCGRGGILRPGEAIRATNGTSFTADFIK